MSDEAADLRQLLLQEAHVLTARIQAQRDQAERLRLLAERIEEKTAVDEVSLEDLRGQLGTAAQLRIDDFDRRLGGQRLERIAIRLLEDSRGEGAEIHYREWFDLIQGEGYTEGDDLGVCDPSAGVARSLGQEIVGRAINGGAESVEVGVQRGLLVDGVVNTADFGLSASNPLITACAVESTI